MTNSLTVCMTTSRQEPELNWFFDSLHRQIKPDDRMAELVISLYPISNSIAPKPSLWQGDYRLTKENWWDVCNARNTALAFCKTDWIAFVDDRCVLSDHWLQSVREAMDGKYVVAGAYEKRHNMKVENGVITDAGTLVAGDCRFEHGTVPPSPCPGEWMFGCCIAMPLEWALRVNGYPEILCGGMGFEDVLFGKIMANNHYPIRYDKRMKVIEDRTPDKLGVTMKRTCKEKHPNDTTDKAHEALRRVVGMRRSENPFGDIREMRSKTQRGEPFPVLNLPTHDWFDNSTIQSFDSL